MANCCLFSNLVILPKIKTFIEKLNLNKIKLDLAFISYKILNLLLYEFKRREIS